MSKSALLSAIDSVLAPKATPAEEKMILEKLSKLTPEERERQQKQWDREYARYRRNVLRSL